ERLDSSVDDEFVSLKGAKDRIGEQRAIRAEYHVPELERNVELPARQTQGSRPRIVFVAGIPVVEQAIHSSEALEGIRSGKHRAVAVIPVGVLSLPLITVGMAEGVKASQHVRIVIVLPQTGPEEVARKAVALRRSVSVVKVYG